jgi:1,4-alpha-glucan branching enzyme
MPSAEPGTIELCLFAPYNENVNLISSWNDWKPERMNKGQDGWWRIHSDLRDGEHFYKFQVKSLSFFAKDQWVEVFDPYALSITNDKLERSYLCIKNGKRLYVEYEWKHDDVPLSNNPDLVIYELHVGDFTGGKGDDTTPRLRGKFAGVVEKLDYLANLGINAVELMPVKEFPGKSWGYNLRSLFAVDSSYGSASDLCRLIDECHGRGIRVIMDGVYNHAEADCPLAKIDYEYWFYRENPDPECMHWGPKYNFTHFDENLKLFPARKYIIESIRDWITHFHMDGVRFDATRAIADFNVMREFTDTAFKMIGGRKPFFTVAEHIPEDPAIVGYPDRGPMVATWHESFAKQLQAIATQHERDGSYPWDLDALEEKANPRTNGFGTGNHTVNYIVSHDQVRIIRQIAEQSGTFGKAAFRRVKLAVAILLTCPGLPMIWMGQEFGAANPKTLEPQPIDWELLKNKDNSDLMNFTAGLIKLRRATPALCSDNFEVLLKDKQSHLFGYKRWNDAGGVVAVLANLNDSASGDIAVDHAGLEDGQWREYVCNFDLEIKDGKLKTSLGPSEVKIFVKQ